ncbi:DNA-binding response regulator [Ramlibacter alkalitolerans]|uniref:DNA-binding response regulator n=1 Tax=Ramlibacter alkalitolerans TaxID=2039631 RepID=A0ABS1JV80_9BURK|nr:DNA-binding response regulator [Ramlibacter alkalitolerans]MBL0428210.1 DNA-binding response regulator [Ramlibacter alkalitolerans]
MNVIRAPCDAALLVGLEPAPLDALRGALHDRFEIFTARCGEQGLLLLEQACLPIVVCEQRMPGLSGLDFLRTVRARWPDTLRILLCDPEDAEDVVRGMAAAGLWQYLPKPWRPGQLLLTLLGAAQVWHLQQEMGRLALERGDAGPAAPAAAGLLREHVERVEARLIGQAMERHQGNKTRVAGELGLTRVGLRMKLAKLGLAKT